MKTRLFCICLTLLTSLAHAVPPSQSELDRQQLARMKPDDRNALEQRIGISFSGFTTGGVLLGGTQTDIESFKGDVVILQPWSFRDITSARTVETLNTDLEGVDGVRVIALHAPEEFEKIKRVLDRKPLPGILVLDDTDTYANPLALTTRGANLIVDRAGIIRYAGIDPSAVRPLVLELLEEPVDENRQPTMTLAAFAAQLAQGEQMTADLEEAWNAGDARSAERLLHDFWTSAPAAALPVTMNLLTNRNTIQRPLAISLLREHAARDTILDAIGLLDERRDGPEIAILVRALGGEDLEEPEQLLAPFLESRDLGVQQAALYALADSATPEVLRAFTRQMSNSPVASNAWSTSDRERILGAQFGIAKHLTGFRASTGREYDEWLDVYERDKEEAQRVSKRSLEDDQGNPVFISYSSDQFRAYPMFDLTVRSQSLGNQLPSENTPTLLMNASTQAAQRAESVLGKIYLAPIRVYLADDRAFSSLASNSFMGGQTEVNRVYLRITRDGPMAEVMGHEWAHVLHMAVFDKTPRWLAEGFAESIETDDHTITLSDLRDQELDEVVERGLFSRLLTWQSGASSDSREGQNYAAARVGVMFLRSGPFSAGDVRLNLLFAHISRGRSERDALQRSFGLSDRELDQTLIDWLSRP